MTTEEIFPVRLKLALKKRRMTQAELCRTISATPWVVCHWCAGKQMPQSRYLPDIARALHVSIDWLMGVDEPMGPPPEPEPEPEPPERPARRKRVIDV